MSMIVILHVFSGRPNPVWVINMGDKRGWRGGVQRALDANHNYSACIKPKTCRCNGWTGILRFYGSGPEWGTFHHDSCWRNRPRTSQHHVYDRRSRVGALAAYDRPPSYPRGGRSLRGARPRNSDSARPYHPPASPNPLHARRPFKPSTLH
jgi:hypothetical protein